MDHDQRMALAVHLATPHVDFKVAGNMTQGTTVAASRILQAYEAIQRAEQLITAKYSAATPA